SKLLKSQGKGRKVACRSPAIPTACSAQPLAAEFTANILDYSGSKPATLRARALVAPLRSVGTPAMGTKGRGPCPPSAARGITAVARAPLLSLIPTSEPNFSIDIASRHARSQVTRSRVLQAKGDDQKRCFLRVIASKTPDCHTFLSRGIPPDRP